MILKNEPASGLEIKIVDNREDYTKALARCAIHDPDKYALPSERRKRYEVGSKKMA